MASWYVCPSSSRFHSSAEIDLLHDRVGLDLVTEAISDDLPVVQHGNSIGQLEGNVHIMLDDQQCDGGIELLKQGRHDVGLGRRQPRGGLVQEEEPGIAGQRQRDLELALLTVREVTDNSRFPFPEARRLPAQSEPAQNDPCSGTERGAGGASRGLRPEPRGDSSPTR